MRTRANCPDFSLLTLLVDFKADQWICYYTLKYALREYDMMVEKLADLKRYDIARKSLPQLHEAYLVRDYLIIIMTL